MSPQLRSVLAKVLDAHYGGENDAKYVIAALVKVAGEPVFTTRLGVEAIRAARKKLFETLGGQGTFSDWMKDPTKRAIVEQVSLATSYCRRRSSGRNPTPLLVEEAGDASG
jgi:hypothetical protein